VSSPPNAETPDGPPIERPRGDEAALLQDLIGALLSSIVQAQSQADATTLAVAMKYSHSPQLVHFPICRASMEEIDITVNMALIAESPSLTASGRSQLMNVMLREGATVLGNPPLKEIVEVYPQLVSGWYCAMPRTMDKVAQVLDEVRFPNADVLASELCLVLANAFFAVVAEYPEIIRVLQPRFPEILDDIQRNDLPALRKRVAEILDEANASESPIRVFYSADALANLPPSAIDQLRIRVMPQSRQLIDVEGQLRVSVE
jgi:hypothetical protein